MNDTDNNAVPIRPQQLLAQLNRWLFAFASHLKGYNQLLRTTGQHA